MGWLESRSEQVLPEACLFLGGFYTETACMWVRIQEEVWSKEENVKFGQQLLTRTDQWGSIAGHEGGGDYESGGSLRGPGMNE